MKFILPVLALLAVADESVSGFQLGFDRQLRVSHRTSGAVGSSSPFLSTTVPKSASSRSKLYMSEALAVEDGGEAEKKGFFSKVNTIDQHPPIAYLCELLSSN